MQKGFSKVSVVVIIGIAAAFGLLFALKKVERPLGGEFQQPYVISATQPGTSYICGPEAANGGVRLSATSSNRVAFKVVVASSTPIFLRWQDRGSNANANGLKLSGSGGSYEMTADDFYVGAFSCYATASSLVTVVEF